MEAHVSSAVLFLYTHSNRAKHVTLLPLPFRARLLQCTAGQHAQSETLSRYDAGYPGPSMAVKGVAHG
jgi:hypothetical protein